MASRMYTQFSYSLEKYPVTIWAVVSFGTTGAPTLNSWNSSQFLPASAALATAGATGYRGVRSVARSSQGTFLFTFQDAYVRLLGADVLFYVSAGNPAAPGLSCSINAITTVATPTLTVRTLQTVTPTDPASGEIGYFTFTFSNASE